MVQDLFAYAAALPTWVIYLVLGAGAAIENVVPPVPADTFVILGGFLAARGVMQPSLVFLATWLPNIGTSLAVYAAARRYGRRFFQLPVARWLLRSHQLAQIDRFYLRRGVTAIFLSRFLPGFRAMVPVFAGLARMPVRKVFPPIALASGLWYGALVYAGALAGRNLDVILRVFGEVSGVLLWLAAALMLLVVVWWWRTRHRHDDA